MSDREPVDLKPIADSLFWLGLFALIAFGWWINR